MNFKLNISIKSALMLQNKCLNGVLDSHFYMELKEVTHGSFLEITQNLGNLYLPMIHTLITQYLARGTYKKFYLMIIMP